MKKATSARDRLLNHFLQNVGRVMDSEELGSVGKISEWARRVRELRQDSGYQILTFKDDASLKPNEYVMRTSERRPTTASGVRAIGGSARAFVLDRDGGVCQLCGAEAGRPHPSFPKRKTVLQVSHILDYEHGGSNDPGNLRALCSYCNEGSAAVTLERPTLTRLKSQVRRATETDKKLLRDWLNEVFADR